MQEILYSGKDIIATEVYLRTQSAIYNINNRDEQQDI